MKQASKKNPVGRPKKKEHEFLPKLKTLPVICTVDEYNIVVQIAKDLKYRSISALVRSAVSKGIWLSAEKGLLTEQKDKVYWEYWSRHWNLTKHLSENDEHLEKIEKLKNKEDC